MLCAKDRHFITDSPGVPPSATAHELFRGFSYVAPGLLVDQSGNASTDTIVAAAATNNNGDISFNYSVSRHHTSRPQTIMNTADIFRD